MMKNLFKLIFFSFSEKKSPSCKNLPYPEKRKKERKKKKKKKKLVLDNSLTTHLHVCMYVCL